MSPLLRPLRTVLLASVSTTCLTTAALADCSPAIPNTGDYVTCSGTTPLNNSGTLSSVQMDQGTLTNSGTITYDAVMSGSNAAFTNQTGGLVGGNALFSGIGGTGINEYGATINGYFVSLGGASLENRGTVGGQIVSFGMQAYSVENYGWASSIQADVTGAQATITNRLGGVISAPSGVEGIKVTVNNGGSAVVVNDGSVTGDTTRIAGSGTASFSNSGTITATGDGFSSGITGVIANSGTIQGTGVGVDAWGTTSLTNSGQIIGGTDGFSSVDQVMGQPSTAQIANSGTISGAGRGVFAVGGLSLTNQSGGTVSGSSFGIAQQGVGSVVIDNQSGGTISSSSGTAIYTEADGASITNGGTISGNPGPGGFAVNTMGAGSTFANLSGGVVNGGVGLFGDNSQFSNAAGGTINGDVQTGRLPTFANAGTITGRFYADSRTYGAPAVGDTTVNNQVGGSIGNGVVVLADSGNIGIANRGQIATSDQRNAAVYVSSWNGVATTIANGNGGVIDGSAAQNGQGVLIAANSGAATVLNQGTIAGQTYGVWHLSTSDFTLSNSGTISSITQAGVSSDAVNTNVTNSGRIDGGVGTGVEASGVLTLNNQVGGTITGAAASVLSTGPGSSIQNSGALVGAVKLQASSGSLTNTSTGTITADNGVEVFRGSVQNQGSIAGVNKGVELQISGSLTNSGTIASTGAFSNGILATSDGTAGASLAITNQSGGTISGIGAGIRQLGTPDQGVTITNNSGATIRATSDNGAGVLVEANGAHVTNAGTIQGVGAHAAGVVLNGTGIHLTNSGTISGFMGVALGIGNDLTNSGTINGVVSSGAGSTIDNSGTINGNVVATPGTTLNSSGSINGNVIMGGDATLSGTVSGNVSNSGQATIADGTTLTAQTFTNANTAALTIGAGATLRGTGASIHNYGTVNSSGTISDATDINNYATGVYNVSGTFTAPLVTNSGTFTLTGDLAGPIARFTQSGTGTLSVGPYAFSGLGNFSNASSSTSAVTIDAGGSMAGSGTFSTTAGTVTNAGTMTFGSYSIGSGASFFSTTGTVNALNSFSNAGTASFGSYTVGAGATFQSTGTAAVSGTFTNNGTAALQGTFIGNVANAGTLTAPGNLTLNGSLTQSGTGSFGIGAFAVTGLSNLTTTSASANAVTVQSGGSLTGSGTLNTSAGTIRNAGTLSFNRYTIGANSSFASTGTVNATTSFTNAGTMALQGTFNSDLTNTGQLGATGNLALNGSLSQSGTGRFSVADKAVSGLTNLTNASSNAGAVVVAQGGSLSGSGALSTTAGQVTNAGTLTFPTISIGAGATFANLGTVNAATSFTNAGTAVMSGTVNGTVATSGTFNVLGTLNVNGDFTQTGAGTLVLHGDNQLNHDTMNISGRATIGGTLSFPVANYAMVPRYGLSVWRNVVTAAGGIDATGLAISTGIPSFTVSELWNADHTALSLEFVGQTGLRLPVTSWNAASIDRSVFQTKYSTAAAGRELDFWVGLGSSTSDRPLDMVSGEGTIDALEAGHTAQRAFLAAGADRARNAIQQSGPSVSLWTGGFGGRNTLPAGGALNSFGFGASVGGSVGGVTVTTDSGLAFGVYGANEQTSWNAAGTGTSGKLKGNHIGAFVSYHTEDGFYVLGAAGYGKLTGQVNRDIPNVGPSGQRQYAHLKGDTFGGKVEAGKRITLDNGIGITPHVGIETEHTRYRNTSEVAVAGPGTYGLDYSRMKSTSVRGEIGVRVDRKIQLGKDSSVTPWAGVSLQHEFNPGRKAQAAFQMFPDAPFAVRGVSARRNAVRVEGGASWQMTKNTSLELWGGSTLGGKHNRDLSGGAALQIKF